MTINGIEIDDALLDYEITAFLRSLMADYNRERAYGGPSALDHQERLNLLKQIMNAEEEEHR